MPTQKKPHREAGKIPLFEMSEKMEPTVRGNPVAKESEQGTPGARDPDVRGNLLRHPYSTLLGDRSPTEYENLKTTLVRAGDVGEIVLLDGAVISDWDRYRIGMELGLTLRTIAYPGDDSLAFVCGQSLQQIQRHASIRALIVLEMQGLAGRGRPKKVTQSVNFSDGAMAPSVAQDLKELAGCSMSLIYQAWDVRQHGLAEAVMSRNMSFNAAKKQVNLIRSVRLSDRVRSGEVGVDAAYRMAESIVSAGLAGEVRSGALTIDDAFAMSRSMAIEPATVAPAGPSQKENPLLFRIEQLEAENAALTRRLLDEPADAKYRAQVTQLESELTRASKRVTEAESRATVAEAEVRRLKNELSQAGIND